jgi:site-specific DNA recombinase
MVVEAEAEVVRRIVDLYLAGTGTTAIAKLLNNDGVPGPSSPKWGDGTVRVILDNAIYSGVLVRGRVRKAGPQKDAPEVPQPEDEWTVVDADLDFHPPILELGMWHKVQQARKRRRRGGHRPGKASVFSGVLKCGGCGGPMNVRHWTVKGGETVYQYRCNTHRVHGGHGCEDPSLVREQDLALAIANRMVELIADGVLAELEAASSLASEEYDRAKRDLAALERRRERQADGYETGLYDKEEFERRTVAYRMERERLEARMDAASAEPDRMAWRADLLEAMFVFSDDLVLPEGDLTVANVPPVVGVNRDRWRQFVALHVDRIDVTGDPDEPFQVTWRLA